MRDIEVGALERIWVDTYSNGEKGPIWPEKPVWAATEYVHIEAAASAASVDAIAARLHGDLVDRHHRAAREGDEETRERLFKLIDEIEWAYPNDIPEPPHD